MTPPDFKTQSRLEQAEGIKRSATRLVNFLSLSRPAPEIIIEAERAMLAKRLADFPIDSEAFEKRLQRERISKYDEHQALEKSGYYVTLCRPDTGDKP